MTQKLLAETGRCVACGLCLPHCPTYRKTQSEADSPRGRILLTQAVMQGVLPMNEKYLAHIDLCLTCRACESVCPNQVPYGQVVDEARALIGINRPLTLAQRLAAFIVSHPAMWRITGMGLRLTNLLGLNRLIPTIPSVTRQYRWKVRYEVSNPVGEVGLFLGCASSILDAETLSAAIFVLNRLGYTVHVPHGQTCCGGLHRQAGDKAGAESLEKCNLQVFTNLPVLAVASGCGARLIETMPGRVSDISTFLCNATSWDKVALQPLDAIIAVHDACSLRNVLKTEKAVYSLLKRIPGADVRPLPGNTQCCGGAGSYMLTQPDMANRLRDDKISACQALNPQYLATSNIGCALHLARGLGDNIKVAHPVWIIARQIGFEGKL